MDGGSEGCLKADSSPGWVAVGVVRGLSGLYSVRLHPGEDAQFGGHQRDVPVDAACSRRACLRMSRSKVGLPSTRDGHPTHSSQPSLGLDSTCQALAQQWRRGE